MWTTAFTGTLSLLLTNNDREDLVTEISTSEQQSVKYPFITGCVAIAVTPNFA